MARRRRRRRASATTHRRRRRRSFATNPVRRHRRRRASGLHRRRRRSYRRNPFGLGRGKGLLSAMPDLVTVGAAAVGAGLLVPLVVGKLNLAGKLVQASDSPSTAALKKAAVGALVGIVLGGIIGKQLRKPKLGAAIALGSVVVPLTTWVQSQKFLGTQGVGDYVEDYYGGSTSGAQYQLPSVDGIGEEDDIDQITNTPF